MLGYYSLTDLLASREQSAVLAELPAAIAAEVPREVHSGPKIDLAGWEAEDLRYWEGVKPGHPMGRIVAKSMGLDAAVIKGVARTDLMKGPGWITTTDLPGGDGNCGISGHRTTYGAPFRKLDRLKKGDTVQFISPFRVYRYRVDRVFAVAPDHVSVLEPLAKPTLTLTACHPPHSARQRLIAQATLVSVKRVKK